VVDFDAYALDCLVHGTVELGDGRLSDQLNRLLELVIRDPRLEDLADGHVVSLPELAVERDELCAVVASGPRGDAARRLHIRTARVKVEVGPYKVEGTVHGKAASEPLGFALRPEAWVPLTEATVAYRRGADDVVDEVPALLVNRRFMTNFRVVD
jgi:hypothetical protein